MKLLLDTNALIWATLQPEALSWRARQAVTDEANVVLVSAAAAWEIATKVRIGKLPGAVVLEQGFLGYMEAAGYTMLPITPEVALRAGRLAGVHRDPFDRMIAAQALALDIPVISADAALDSFGVMRIW